jgi:hypothetical protein
MTSFGEKCQKAGHKALKCLTPVFKKPELSCDVAVNQALTKCAKQVAAFDRCKNGGTAPQPNPQPDPPDPPEPTPSCGGTTGGTPEYCYNAYTCPEGVYLATCSLIPGNAAFNCSCSYPSGMAQGFTIGSMTPPCDQATQLCGFSPAILQ